MLPNSLPNWCIVGNRNSPNKQVSSPSNTNARTRQHMQSSSPMDPITLQNPWQRASRSASQMLSTRRATINQHSLPGPKPPSSKRRWNPDRRRLHITFSTGMATTAFRPQQAQRTHAQETKYCSFPNVHGATKLVSLHDLQTEVKWRSLEERRRGYRLTLLNYKMYNGLSPNYLSSLVPPPNFQCETSEIQIIFALFSPAHLCTSSVPRLFITYIMRHIWIAWVPRMICVLQLFSSCSHQGNATIYLMR